MKIRRDKESLNLSELHKIPVGTVFEFQGGYFLKVANQGFDKNIKSGTFYINLTTGLVADCFGPFILVRPLYEAECVVRG